MYQIQYKHRYTDEEGILQEALEAENHEELEERCEQLNAQHPHLSCFVTLVNDERDAS